MAAAVRSRTLVVVGRDDARVQERCQPQGRPCGSRRQRHQQLIPPEQATHTGWWEGPAGGEGRRASGVAYGLCVGRRHPLAVAVQQARSSPQGGCVAHLQAKPAAVSSPIHTVVTASVMGRVAPVNDTINMTQFTRMRLHALRSMLLFATRWRHIRPLALVGPM